ncbi:PAS domain-containing protein [Streptomyces sp. MST-110588]|uniref:PAS domain-containing protein n=1 Tax=Streptomyces sp. MST-110588 TaxID=2833628 RepID=UPI001F5D1B62|nr:PAS domain-containing protein [Streptomyces sp. MST-110588]
MPEQARSTADQDPPQPDSDDSGLLAALLDGMDAALCAFGADGTVTHWNREAERILGWTAEEAVGRPGLAGWAVRKEDAEGVQAGLLAAMTAPGRQVNEFALLTKDGRRVLVRTQSSAVTGADGKPVGVYCAFSEVHAQIDLERSIALSEALFDDASWGVVLVDADLRPAVVNTHAARALGVGRTAMLGRPLGDLLAQGVEELEGALQHVLAEGAPPAAAELWVTLRSADAEETRRCWRSGFLRLASPLAEEPVPLGVGWLFQDITEAKRAEQESSLLRFRAQQLHRAGRAAGECEDPVEAAAVHLDFALAGFADHGLVDLAAAARGASGVSGASGAAGTSGAGTGAGAGVSAVSGGGGDASVSGAFGAADAAETAGVEGAGGVAEAAGKQSAAGDVNADADTGADTDARADSPAGAGNVPQGAAWLDVSPGPGPSGGLSGPSGASGPSGMSGAVDDPGAGGLSGHGALRLVRAIASPAGAPGPSEAVPATGIPVAYGANHPAMQAFERRGSVRAAAGAVPAEGWAAARKWPDGTVHGLCAVLRSRGRTLGVVTFLRGASRRPFDRADAMYAEDVAARIAAALDLSGLPAGR